MFEERYKRQIKFQHIGIEGQHKLKTKKVAIVGMGALGSAIAHHLVRMGVGFLKIIDSDIVELSNLPRQMLYTEEDVVNKRLKVESAKERLLAINSEVIIETYASRLTAENASILLSDVDLILDGTDNFPTRYIINKTAVKLNIPWIYGGVVGARGTTFTIRPHITPCFQCIFPHPPTEEHVPLCHTNGVLSPIIQVIASIEAIEGVKILLEKWQDLRNSMLNIDLWNNDFISIDLTGAHNKDCPICRTE